MKKWIFSLLLLLTAFVGKAENIGTWTPHLAYHTATQSIAVGGMVYTLYQSNLLAYNVKDTQVRTFSKADGLSGKEIALLGYSSSQKWLVLVYKDGVVDLLNPESGEVATLAYLKSNAETTGAPVALSVNGDYATVALTKGVAVYNVARVELRGFYPLAAAPKTATVLGGMLYVAGDAGIKGGNLAANLYDVAQWQTVSATPTAQLLPLGNTLYALGGDGLWKYDGGNAALVSGAQRLSATVYARGEVSGTNAIFSNAGEVAVFAAASPGAPQAVYAHANAWTSVSRTSDGTLWMAQGGDGLVGYRPSGASLAATGQKIGGYGPVRDLCASMTFAGQRLIVAGGTLDLYASRPGTIMVYENGKWSHFREDNIRPVSDLPYLNVTSVVQDPTDASRHIAGGQSGLYFFKDGSITAAKHRYNSPLLIKYDKEAVHALAYDPQGNLWMAQEYMQDTIFRVLRTDGKWSRLFVPAMKGSYRIENTYFDTKGRLWATSGVWIGTNVGGIHCVDYKGTIDDPSDDVARFRSNVINEDGAPVDLQSGVRSFVRDLNGRFWVGHSNGVFYFDNLDDFNTDDFRVVQPKIPRNDGTSLADYLLQGIYVTSIAVDGANRKWIGTNGSGVYLVSEDGTEVIEHFTKENSALLSDDILSIAPNMETGEIFFGTEGGIIAYQSDATKALDALVRSNVKVYPNPVAHERNMVHVTGLTAGTTVKIMTTSGFAVAAGKATGGSFAWDLKGPSKKRVGGGVYYVLAATPDGKTGIVAKVVVI